MSRFKKIESNFDEQRKMSNRHYDFFKKLGYSENENLSDANEEDIKYVENCFKQHFEEYVIDDIQLCSNNELWNRYRSW